MDIVNISIYAITGVIFAIILKPVRPEIAHIISIFLCVFIFMYVLTKVSAVMSLIGEMKKLVDIDETYVSCILKIIGISYISEISADLCKDAGYSAVANQISIFGKVSILVICIPVILGLVQAITTFLG